MICTFNSYVDISTSPFDSIVVFSWFQQEIVFCIQEHKKENNIGLNLTTEQ